MRIDLIINPRARLYQRDPALLEAMREVGRGRSRVHVTDSLAELERCCGELADCGSDLVVVSGGDGTLMATVSALARTHGGRPLPPLTPIPGGTAGTVARNWGLHGEPTACLRRVFERPRRRVPRATLQVEADDDRRVGFIFGTGLVAKFFGLYYERGAPGYAGSARLVSRIFAESFVGGPLARRVLDPLPCRLEVNGRPTGPEAWSLICSATVRDLGIHMLVTYRAAEDRRRPHLVATPMGPRQLGPRAPLVLSGRPLGGPHHVDDLVESFAVTFPHDRGPFVLDGELLHARRVVVTAGPELCVLEPC